MNDYQKKDYKKYFLPKGDKGFSIEKNKAVIERTILKTEKLREQKAKEYEEAVRERAEAVTDWLFSPRGAQMQKSIEQYFGKDELMRLKAQDIKNKLMRPIISKLKQGG